MSIKPIIFSGPMVRALLAGRKTQTRRVLKDAPHGSGTVTVSVEPYACPDGRWNWVIAETGMGTRDPFRLPYAPGDLLWARESAHRNPDLWHYTADSFEVPWPGRKPLASYKRDTMPSIHLPRVASRLTLEVTDVRVQRAQDISEEDAKAEGALPEFEVDLATFVRGKGADIARRSTYRLGFKHLWDRLNKSRGYGWEANPWVCAISFRVHRCNVDSPDMQRLNRSA